MSKEYEEKRGPRGADDHTEKRFPRERRAEERGVPVRERDAGADGLIEGRNAVTEALRAGTPIDKIFIARGETDKTLGHIASTARAAGVVVVEADRRKLDYMSATKAHQGVIALAAVREYASVEDILSAARERGEAPLLVVCDEISDPHNLGAIMRSCAHFGVKGVVVQDAGMLESGAAIRTAEGGAEHVEPITGDSFIDTLEQFRKAGYAIVSTSSHNGTPLHKAELPKKMVLALGQERDGLSDAAISSADLNVAIEGTGNVESLNVSVATGVLLAEWWRQNKA